MSEASSSAAPRWRRCSPTAATICSSCRGSARPPGTLAAAGDDDRNFYLWGAMGGAAMIGLGLALAQPDKRVAVITGDGEMLMGMGALATIGVQQPNNLAVIVFDNGVYGETGMQPSHTQSGVDLLGGRARLRHRAMPRRARRGRPGRPRRAAERLARDLVRPRADRGGRSAARAAGARRHRAQGPVPRRARGQTVTSMRVRGRSGQCRIEPL